LSENFILNWTINNVRTFDNSVCVNEIILPAKLIRVRSNNPYNFLNDKWKIDLQIKSNIVTKEVWKPKKSLIKASDIFAAILNHDVISEKSYVKVPCMPFVNKENLGKTK